MQNPKFFVLICAIALGAVVSVPAQDTPAQAAARAAVAQKLAEISAEEGTNSTVATPPTALAPLDQPVVQKPAEEPTLAPINSSTPPTASEKAEAAKLVAAQAKAQKEAAKQAAAQKKADEAAAKAKARADQKAAALKAKQDAAAAKAAATQPAPAMAPNATAANDQSSAAMAAVAKAQTDQATQPAGTTLPASTMPFYTPPPPPVSADKVQKLDDLLTKYRADQVTPAEYQAQRAAILAQP